MLYWLLLLTLATVADLMAGQFLSGRIPNIDRIFSTISRRISEKLDRRERSKGALRTRGLVVLTLCLPLFYFLGGLMDMLSRMSAAGTAVALLALVPIVSQRKFWSEHAETGRQIATGKTIADPHTAAQTTSQNIILRYSTSFLPAILLFAVGGFALLMPVRFLTSFLETGTKSSQRLSPFYKYAHWLHELVFLPISLVAALFLGLAHFFIPGTNLGVFWKLAPNKTQTIASHFIPLNIMANGANLNFLRQGGTKSLLASEGKWIGPDGGRAKLTPKDMRSIWLVVLAAFGLSLVVLTMIFVFLTVTFTNDL